MSDPGYTLQPMNTAAFILYTLALVSQLYGGFLVVRQVVRTQVSVRQFKRDLDAADKTRRTHRSTMEESKRNYDRKTSSYPATLAIQHHPGLRSLDTAMRQLSAPDTLDHLADIGPASADERHAMRNLLSREFPTQSGKLTGPWLGVGLLFGGIVLSYAAAVLTLL